MCTRIGRSMVGKPGYIIQHVLTVRKEKVLTKPQVRKMDVGVVHFIAYTMLKSLQMLTDLMLVNARFVIQCNNL
jgi:hypothetical protein